MATIVMVVAMSLLLNLLSTVAKERKAAERRQRAGLEVANLMERITAHPFDLVTAELARKLTISETARQTLRDAELAALVSESAQDTAGAPAGKRISISLRCGASSSGQWEAPVRLTSWIARQGNGS